MKKNIKNARLREIRKQAGVTQQELADYLNMSRGSYQHLEAKGILTGDILVKLSRFFGVSVEFILGTEDNEPETTDDTALKVGTNISETSPTRFKESQNPNVTNIVLSDNETELLQLFKRLPYEEQLRLLGYIAGVIDKSK